jgi:hypothetical protein
MIPRTDRERIYWLEARVAELEEVLAAIQRAQADQDRAMDKHVRVLRPVLRAAYAKAGGRSPAVMLCLLLAHPGREVHRDTMFDHTRGGLSRTEDASTRSLQVRMVHLRRALLALGFGNVVKTINGEGWRIDAADAQRIKDALLPV